MRRCAPARTPTSLSQQTLARNAARRRQLVSYATNFGPPNARYAGGVGPVGGGHVGRRRHPKSRLRQPCLTAFGLTVPLIL